MRKIVSMGIVAVLSATLAGCWGYSSQDATTGCQKTAYGVAVASTSSENCPPAASGTSAPTAPANIPPGPPPIPSPGTL
jgi:hypothetical protein